MCEILGSLIDPQADEVQLAGAHHQDFSTDNSSPSGNAMKDKSMLDMDVRFFFGMQVLLKQKPLAIDFPAGLQQTLGRMPITTILLRRLIALLLGLAAMVSSVYGFSALSRGGDFCLAAANPRWILCGSAVKRLCIGLVLEQINHCRGGVHGKRAAAMCWCGAGT